MTHEPEIAERSGAESSSPQPFQIICSVSLMVTEVVIFPFCGEMDEATLLTKPNSSILL